MVLNITVPTQECEISVTTRCYCRVASSAAKRSGKTRLPVDSQSANTVRSNQKNHRYTSSPSQTDPPARV